MTQPEAAPETQSGGVTLDDDGQPVPFTITEKEGLEEFIKGKEEGGPVTTDGGVHTTDRP